MRPSFCEAVHIGDDTCTARQKLLPHLYRVEARGVATGVYRHIYPKSVYLNFFMWLFCLLDPFMPTQIKFLATPLVEAAINIVGLSAAPALG